MNIKKISLFFVVSSFLLGNCGQSTKIPVSYQPTPSIIPFPTTSPTPYILPTLTPPSNPNKSIRPSATTVIKLPTTEFPTVKINTPSALSSPPYLMYIKKNNGKEQIVLIDQNGSGKKTIALPDDGFNAGNPSPTGEWIVFYTGSGGEQTLTTGPKYDLALNLMHLPDGTTHKVIDLLSNDFPDNLEKFAEMAKNNDPDLESMNTTTIVDTARQTFIYSLYASRWSPSGEVLAFSGEMDGPSTDLYLYNLKTSRINRLSSGSQNIDFIDWFPGGDQILYSSSYLPCEGDCSTYYVTNLDGSVSKKIKDFDSFSGATSFSNWSDATMMTVFTRANVTGTCCLRNFNFENEKQHMLYGGSFQNYAYDPQSNILAISIADNLENITPGTYFINEEGMREVEDFGTVYYLGWPDFPFVLSANETKLLSTSGKSKIIAADMYAPFASRNNKYIALCDLTWGNTKNGLKVFDNKGNLILEFKNQEVTNVIWRIDSQGLFYVSKNQLYYIGIQEKTPTLIDNHLNDNEFITKYTYFSWVR